MMSREAISGTGHPAEGLEDKPKINHQKYPNLLPEG